MSVKFKGIIGAEELLANLEDICGSIEEACVRTIEKTQEEFVDKAGNAVKVDTGMTKESIHDTGVERIDDGNHVTFKGAVEASEGALYLEFGTGKRGSENVNPEFKGDIKYTLYKDDIKHGQRKSRNETKRKPRKKSDDGTKKTQKVNTDEFLGMYPQPFFYPSLIEMRDKFKDGAVELITDALNSGGE